MGDAAATGGEGRVWRGHFPSGTWHLGPPEAPEPGLSSSGEPTSSSSAQTVHSHSAASSRGSPAPRGVGDRRTRKSHVRDSKCTDGPRLALAPAAWADFVAYTSGQFSPLLCLVMRS
ncbi:DUF397 domain-containing protein [Streptomyces sp. NPDC127092]|uniref:DUF397 domain-containing protein n=1 Tax=Streptomyces sp. NPDC127092 TaxID=3347135 RepID=UPI00365B02F6